MSPFAETHNCDGAAPAISILNPELELRSINVLQEFLSCIVESFGQGGCSLHSHTDTFSKHNKQARTPYRASNLVGIEVEVGPREAGDHVKPKTHSKGVSQWHQHLINKTQDAAPATFLRYLSM